MVGNLIDNACKWAASRVEVRVGSAARDDGRNASRSRLRTMGRGSPRAAGRRC